MRGRCSLPGMKRKTHGVPGNGTVWKLQQVWAMHICLLCNHWKNLPDFFLAFFLFFFCTKFKVMEKGSCQCYFHRSWEQWQSGLRFAVAEWWSFLFAGFVDGWHSLASTMMRDLAKDKAWQMNNKWKYNSLFPSPESYLLDWPAWPRLAAALGATHCAHLLEGRSQVQGGGWKKWRNCVSLHGISVVDIIQSWFILRFKYWRWWKFFWLLQDGWNSMRWLHEQFVIQNKK